MLQNFLLVGAGGALGSMGRYGLTLLARAMTLHPTLGTLTANVVGSMLIGWAMTRVDGRAGLFLAMGVCGGFTTFSTFSAQTMAMLSQGQWLTATLYAVGSVVLCVASAALGAWLGR